MGTHISRVKSVDLDSWTDEQLQSVLSWGNARANKYWEAKLAAGHAPSETKIENFIRTKYELKRWVMDGPIPDPATLDTAGDDDVPLSIVKEKQVVERNETIRKASIGQSQRPRNLPPPVADLIGGDDPIPVRSSTTGPPLAKLPPKADPAPPKSTSTKDSLLGLDFFGESSAPPRPASTTGVTSPGGQSRPDLKQSILSLYASAPKPQPPPQQQQQQHFQQQQSGGFGGMGHQQQGSVGGFNDAFSSLSMSNTAAPKPADPFASLGSGTRSPPQHQHSGSGAFGGLSGGSFFDSQPTQRAAPLNQQQKPSSGGLGGFGAFSTPAPMSNAAPQPSSAMSDLSAFASAPAPYTQSTQTNVSKPSVGISSAGAFGADPWGGNEWGTPAAAQPTAPPPTQNNPPAKPQTSSVFDLSSTQNKPSAVPAPVPAPASTGAFGITGISGADAWGGNEWASGGGNSFAAAAPSAPAQHSPALTKASSSGLGWGGSSFASTPIVPGSGGGFNPTPKVAADEEFGGWASSTGPSAGSAAAPSKPAGGMGGDNDLFSNVWE